MYCQVKHCRFNTTHVTSGHKCGTCGQYGHGQIECSGSRKHLEKYLNDKLPDYLQCKIANCKYKWSHTVAAHTCSHCGEREHGKDTCPQITVNLDCPICKTPNQVSQKLINNAYQFTSDNNCCICLSNKANVYFKECHHVCICTECFIKLKPSENINVQIVLESEIPDYVVTNARQQLQDNTNVYCTIYGGMGCTWYIRKRGTNIEGFFMHSDNWGQYGPGTDDRPSLERFISGYNFI